MKAPRTLIQNVESIHNLSHRRAIFGINVQFLKRLFTTREGENLSWTMQHTQPYRIDSDFILSLKGFIKLL